VGDNGSDELSRNAQLCLYVLEVDPRRPEPMPVTVIAGRLRGDYGIRLGTSEARRVLNDLARRGRIRRHKHRTAAGVERRDRYSLHT